MKISYNWLKKHIELNETPEEISDLLTNCGLEVEDFYEHQVIKGGLKGLIVGHVLSVEKHPGADKLKITKVDIGNGEILQIVCGAPNVKQGQKVVVATVGTTIYPLNSEPFKIKKAKIRGIESNGMICAEDEIGLGTNHEGILILDENCLQGKLVTDYIKTPNDFIFEIGLTANRGDAASHLGVARDLKALLNRNLIKPKTFEITTAQNKMPLSISIKSDDLCEKYCGILIKDINVKPSPDWLSSKLSSIGLNSINNIVDITNYILHDTGQPIHAFDFDKLNGNIEVRNANPNEKIITLNKEEKKLNGQEMVIADHNGPVALAGVIGGLNTCVDNNTKNIFIESACFDMSAVRKTSKITGISTDSSFRFERGINPENTYNAMIEAAAMVLEIAGGKIEFLPVEVNSKLIEPAQVFISFDKLKRILGVEIEKNVVKTIVSNLEMKIVEENNEGLKLIIPRYRTDITRDIDVFEDILRIYGFDKIAFPENVNTAIVNSAIPDKHLIKQKISNYLKSQGFNEIMTNSLTSDNYYDETEKNELVYLSNPLSNELAVMRHSMLPTMLESVAYNKNRKIHDNKFFEFGKIYHKNEDGNYFEIEKIALIVSGNRETTNWIKKPEYADYFYLKTIVENIVLHAGGINFNTPKISKVEKKLLDKTDVNTEVWFAELNFEKLLNNISKNKFELRDVPVFPEVSRDLNLIIDEAVNYSDIEKIVKNTVGKYLQKINMTDVYKGKTLEEGKKSYTFNILLYDSEKTMTDKQIDYIMQKLIFTFETELGAFIRK
ncbi:MAG: phenylalanine--tRNA ligase subunit beta [Bacteroidetes bacterium]|nr:phenylalanine--tRNA ligase subunit beta [Bacteroidota bacterium]